MYSIKKILITTGAGNTIVGGADIWTNLFIENVWETLENKDDFILLIDSKRPTNFDEKSLPFDLNFCFYYDDRLFADKLLNECEEIIFLHSHYHLRPHIQTHYKKYSTIFVHAYAKDIVDAANELPEIAKLMLQTKVESEFYDVFLSDFKQVIWIGNNYSVVMEKYSKTSSNIPNFYEFKYNLPLTEIKSKKIGFASRCETRKCYHWLDNHVGFSLTNKRDVMNIKETTEFNLNKIRTYQWSPDIHDLFMRKNWGIFHGAYFKEPFGYSIFQSVDYGKLPIINKDWGVEVDYKYRVSTKSEFDDCIEMIYSDSYESQLVEWNKLKDYMKTFDNKKMWIERIKTLF